MKDLFNYKLAESAYHLDLRDMAWFLSPISLWNSRLSVIIWSSEGIPNGGADTLSSSSIVMPLGAEVLACLKYFCAWALTGDDRSIIVIAIPI